MNQEFPLAKSGRMIVPLSAFKSSECACAECQQMCRRSPCWPTPRDVIRLIRSGHGGRLMLDWWEGESDLPYTEIVCPAEIGKEAKRASKWRDIGCSFFVNGLCVIHSIKPTEGRLAIHSGYGPIYNSLHLAVARTWNTASGQRVVRYWKHHFPRWQQRF